MTLQAALAESTTPGDQVWIAVGTYEPDDATDRTATFTILEGVLVYGGFVGTDVATDDDGFDPTAGTDDRARETDGTLTNITILSGDLGSDDGDDPEASGYDATRDDNSNTVVTVTSPNVTLNGLTITAGEEGTPSGSDRRGAGLFVNVASANVSLMECTFTNNRIPGENHFWRGGGAYLSGGGNLQNCVFKNNTARFGGGLTCQSGDFTLTNCVFINNNAIVNGGGLFTNNVLSTKITNCVFANNVSASLGGAIVAGTGNKNQITNCTFYGNRTEGTGGSIYFGDFGNGYIVNNIFTGNLSSSSRGRQLDITGGGSVTIDHNIIEGGDAGVGILESRGGTVIITNTIDATSTEVFAAVAPLRERFLRLKVGGPAIDAGNDDYLNNDTPADTNDDITTDVAGNMRIQGTAVDLGAYEGGFDPLPSLIFHVKHDATGTELGADWASAITLRRALANSSINDQIWIAAGTYKPHASDRTATFTIPPGVSVYGGFVGTEAASFDPATTARTGGETILSGDLDEDDGTPPAEGATADVIAAYNSSGTRVDNSHTVVTLGGPQTTLDGLSIVGGVGPEAQSNENVENPNSGDNPNDDDPPPPPPIYTQLDLGAGLYASSDALNAVVTNCIFKNNSIAGSGGDDGGGGGAYFNSSVSLTNCTFMNNSSTGFGSSAGAYFDGTATLSNCTFTGNTSTGFSSSAGAYFDRGATLTGCTFTGNTSTGSVSSGGASFNGVGITLSDCSFAGNRAMGSTFGGGAYFLENPTLSNCTFTDNEAGQGGGAYFEGFATLSNCSFAGNSTINDNGNGGGAYFEYSATLSNCTFYMNSAVQKGGGLYATAIGSSVFNLRNSILIGNTAAEGNEVYLNYRKGTRGSASVDYNLVGGGALGVVVKTPSNPNVTVTNIRHAADGAALFSSVDVDNESFLRLNDGTVALNAGNNDYVDNAVPPITLDAAGNARKQGDPTTPRVDLGAYESTFETFMKAPQTIDFPLPNMGNPEQEIDLKATATSGLLVTFTSSATNIAEIGTGDKAGKLILKAAGMATITATQAGNNDFGVGIKEVTVTVTPANIRRAKPAATGMMDGSSWDDAMTLTDALVASTMSGDQVWVEAGTYKPGTVADSNNPTDVERGMTFTIPAGVQVYGGFAGTEASFVPDDPLTPTNEDTRARNADGTFTNVTILSGDLNGGDDPLVADTRDDNSYTVVTVTGADVVLDGLTVKAGVRGTQFDYPDEMYYYGGGLYAQEAATNIVVRNCTFSGNSSDSDGGGAYFSGTATLSNCVFENNSAIGFEGLGGGAYFSDVATLSNCTFTGNNVVEAESLGGGACFFAGATLTNCIFTDNTATGLENLGGGAHFFADATLTNCVFTGNMVTGMESLGGGAHFLANATLTNCTFYNNMANQNGGALSTTGKTFNLRNSILIDNTTDEATGSEVYLFGLGSIVSGIDRNIISSGMAGVTMGMSMVIAPSTSIQDGTAAEVFESVMPENADFLRLKDRSPAINAGLNDYVPTGIVTDAGGNARILNNIVDLGAYESNFSKDTQTISFTLASTGFVGDEIDLTATSSSGLLVTFTSSDAAIAEIGTGDKAGKLILKTAGTATITASQAGDVTYAPASFMQTIVVSKKTQNLSFNLAQNVVNRNVPTLMLTASSDNTLPIVFSLENQMTDAGGTGNVVTLMDNMDGTATLTLVATGTVTVTASQAGNDVYNTASISHTLTVTDKVLQMITFTLAPTGSVGDEIGLTATTDATGLNVSFAIDPATGVATLVDNDDGTGMLTLTGEGMATITASQAGDETYAPASVMQTIVVSKKEQNLSFTLASTGSVGDGIPLSATTDATGLNVSFAINPPAGVATLVDNGNGTGMLTLTGGGTVIVTASQAGNETYAAATDVTRTLTVSKQAQAITFTLAMTGTVNAKIDLNATADSSLPVSYTSSDPDVASIGTGTDAGKLVLNALGMATITASQAGNGTYAAATDVTQTITVAAALGIAGLPGLSFYPNPSEGMLGIRGVTGNLRLTIHDLSGRTVAGYTLGPGDTAIDVSVLPQGIYEVTLQMGGKRATRRLIRK